MSLGITGAGGCVQLVVVGKPFEILSIKFPNKF